MRERKRGVRRHTCPGLGQRNHRGRGEVRYGGQHAAPPPSGINTAVEVGREATTTTKGIEGTPTTLLAAPPASGRYTRSAAPMLPTTIQSAPPKKAKVVWGWVQHSLVKVDSTRSFLHEGTTQQRITTTGSGQGRVCLPASSEGIGTTARLLISKTSSPSAPSARGM